jgi:hypothetical protein
MRVLQLLDAIFALFQPKIKPEYEQLRRTFNGAGRSARYTHATPIPTYLNGDCPEAPVDSYFLRTSLLAHQWLTAAVILRIHSQRRSRKDILCQQPTDVEANAAS